MKKMGLINNENDYTVKNGILIKYIGKEEKIVIPSSVTIIGNYAFAFCSSLTDITIPDSVISIGEDAFYNCSSLRSIIIPDSVTSIGENAFRYCSSLRSIKIPDSVTSIGENAFDGCWIKEAIILAIACPYIRNSMLEKVVITSGTSIGEDVFSLCDNLTSITLPEGLINIGEDAFSNCSSLKSITIPSSVTSIGHNAFFGCTSLRSIIVNKDNKVYDSRGNSNAIIETKTNTLIKGCDSTIIPDTVTSIGESAFELCKVLTSIIIGNSITSIGESAFSGCTSLRSIIVDKDNKVYDSRDNSNAIIETKTNTLIQGCSSTIIPNSIESIGSFAFGKCSTLTNIVIPNGVKSIGDFAFVACRSLTSIIIPNSVTNIGNGAFWICLSLKIYCEAPIEPYGWSSMWNESNRPVVWGYAKE